MCFSMTASFSAALALLICGVAALKYAREKRLRMIAAVPLIFAFQQCAEGLVWASFAYSQLAFIRMISAYLFFACAGMLWPIWVPIAIARFEGASRYKWFLPSCVAGIMHACAFMMCALWYQLSVMVVNHHIVYNFVDIQGAQVVWGMIFALLYIIATVVPFFIARNKTLWFIGALIAIAYAVSYTIYFEAFTSVWCFFAALISILVFWFIRQQQLHHHK